MNYDELIPVLVKIKKDLEVVLDMLSLLQYKDDGRTANNAEMAEHQFDVNRDKITE